MAVVMWINEYECEEYKIKGTLIKELHVFTHR